MPKQVTDSDYRAVQATMNPFPDPKVAQEFLEAVDFGQDRKFFQEVKYKEGAKEQGYIMEYESGKITAFGNSFSKGFPVFMSFLVVHETHHAKQEYFQRLKEMRRLNGGIFYKESLVEIPAILAQLTDLRFQLLAKDLIILENCLSSHQEIVKTVGNMIYRTGLDAWKSDLAKILLPPPYDDVVRARYGL
ncbi:hypothetical protein KA107_01025 [Candidatus Pacearchaeota archaeon]|nr:hypothetical protein [Candidatus Pacearchaeota archaeon]